MAKYEVNQDPYTDPETGVLYKDEKSLVDARKAAMKTANDLYIALQKEALDMDSQAKQTQEQKQEQTKIQTHPRGRGR